MTSRAFLTAIPAPPDPRFEVGWDFARYSLVPPVEEVLPGNPVRDDWKTEQSIFGTRTLRAGLPDHRPDANPCHAADQMVVD